MQHWAIISSPPRYAILHQAPHKSAAFVFAGCPSKAPATRDRASRASFWTAWHGSTPEMRQPGLVLGRLAHLLIEGRKNGRWKVLIKK